MCIPYNMASHDHDDLSSCTFRVEDAGFRRIRRLRKVIGASCQHRHRRCCVLQFNYLRLPPAFGPPCIDATEDMPVVFCIKIFPDLLKESLHQFLVHGQFDCPAGVRC